MTRTDKEIRSAVRASYATIAVDKASCCSPGEAEAPDIGYDPADLAGLPDEAIMGLGCGNPVTLADIAEGETVLDLGSGGGIDVFLAARSTGPTGRVIGVDMTGEMLERAEANLARAGIENVEFRRGLIEDLPVDDASVDVIISNCVINLAPDKARGPVGAWWSPTWSPARPCPMRSATIWAPGPPVWAGPSPRTTTSQSSATQGSRGWRCSNAKATA